MEFWNRLIFPDNLYCMCCQDCLPPGRKHGLCDKCLERIDWNTKNPFGSVMNEFSLDDIWPCCVYGYWPRRIVYGLKSDGNTYFAKSMARFMSERIETSGILVPIPLYKAKLARRGFNQSELLAKNISIASGLPYKDLLIKTEATPEMKSKSGTERRALLRDCIKIKPAFIDSVCGQNIILVDDVVTTASTASAATDVLKGAGASAVYLLVFTSANNVSII